MAWQQQQYDEVVPDIFGQCALQLGTPSIGGLHHSRILHAWVTSQNPAATTRPPDPAGTSTSFPALVARTEALPFAAEQFDLILLPHTLEASERPHHTLQEANRILRPEGRLIISGFNPLRIWGVRPGHHELHWGSSVSPLQVRNWLRPLGYEINRLHTGCCLPSFQRASWIRHLQWIDHFVTSRWCVWGGIYFLVATKHVHGSKILGLSQLHHKPCIASVTA